MSTNEISLLGSGAYVAIDTRSDLVEMETIERVTKTQIILSTGERFRRATGLKVGKYDPWNPRVIVPWTKKHRQRLANQKEVRRRGAILAAIRRIYPHKLTREQVSLLSRVVHIEKEKQ